MTNPETTPDEESSPERRPRPGWRVRVAVVAASVLVALLIFELFLRAVGFSFPAWYVPDPTRGYAFRPGAEGWHTREGRSYVRVNGDGLRDREYARRKPEGALRVAVLGDSYAEALQVAEEDGFTSVLERELARCPALAGRAVEVINFGVSGYGTAQELLTLREKVWAYAPDVVLLAVTTNNDVADNARELKDADDLPFFVLRGEELVLDDSFRESPSFRRRSSALGRAGGWFHAHLRLVQAVHKAQTVIKSKLAERRDRRRAQEAEARREASRAAAPAQEAQGAGQVAQGAQEVVAQAGGGPPAAAPRPDLANMVYLEPPDEVWRGAWRVTERLVLEMRREVEGRGAKFAVVTLSNPIQVYPDPAVRAAFLARLGPGADLFYPNRRYEEFGRREGLTVFTLAPELQAHADRRGAYLHGFPGDLGNGHWNEEGHRVAGELLTQKLCEWLAR